MSLIATSNFKVVAIDPDGSGTDYRNHLGTFVCEGKRCCRNCTIIFGKDLWGNEYGPFTPIELQALDTEALAVQNAIRGQFPTSQFPPHGIHTFDADVSCVAWDIVLDPDL